MDVALSHHSLDSTEILDHLRLLQKSPFNQNRNVRRQRLFGIQALEIRIQERQGHGLQKRLLGMIDFIS